MNATPEFIHWSAEPLALEHLESRGPVHAWRRDKPSGLWFSVGDGSDGWREWCENESYCLDALKWRNKIVLRSDARILHISGAADIDAFADKHSLGDMPEWRGAINWSDVAEEYQGIVIAPYCWSRRLKTPFYYGWDCASGCIWDVSCIEAIESVEAVSA